MTDLASIVDGRHPVEQGDPAADSRAFRRCLGQYPTGVTVITARHGDEVVGMAVNSFAAVSLDPALVLWSIRRESKSLDAFLGASHFAVNVLAADQVQVSHWFGSAHPERFQLAPWRPGQGGAPLLDGALAHLECRRVQVDDGGDHLILRGHVERYARYEGEPLVFSQGQYAVSQSHPNLVTQARSGSSEQPQSDGGPSFLRLLSLAHQHMSALFDAHREDLGMTVGSTRVLTRLCDGACSLDALQRATYLGWQSVEDTVMDLIQSGLALRRADGGVEITAAGRMKSEAVAQRLLEFTRQQLQGIAEQDVAAARRVFAALQQR